MPDKKLALADMMAMRMSPYMTTLLYKVVDLIFLMKNVISHDREKLILALEIKVDVK